MPYKYHNAALGGTFDLLHKGHTTLLEKAFNISKFVTIGITSDKFCKGFGIIPSESQTQRRKNLLAYLKTRRFEKRSRIIWLEDIYGNTAKDNKIEALVVSKETLPGASQINKKREAAKLKKLAVIVAPEILAQDGKRISSTRIREGTISKDGTDYLKLLLKIAGVRFSDQIRANLKKPFGKFVKIQKGLKFARPVISIGDVSTKNLLEAKIIPDISVVDLFVNRKRVFDNLTQIGFNQPNPDFVIKNTPGQISKDLIFALHKAIHTKGTGKIIQVNGEEDLAFIPALLLSPFPSTIFYGQPNIGQVMTPISIETKNKLCSILKLA